MRRTPSQLAAAAVGLWLPLAYKSSPAARSSALGVATPTTLPPADTRTTSATSTTLGMRTITGDAIPTKYGDFQVAVTLSGTRIVDVQALVYPTDHGDSRRIQARALPLLHDEAVQAQSAQIDTVTGATYTSFGYAQ